MSDDLSRREFVLASLATAVVGCRSSESEKPLVRFGMEDYRPGNSSRVVVKGFVKAASFDKRM